MHSALKMSVRLLLQGTFLKMFAIFRTLSLKHDVKVLYYKNYCSVMKHFGFP